MLDSQVSARPTVGFLSVVCLAAASAFISWQAWSLVLPAPRLLRIAFLDVGQGDGIVIESPGGKTMVVDCGPAGAAGRPDATSRGDRSETGNPGSRSQGMSTIVPYLRSRGIQRLDAVLLTHPDLDHIGGAPDLLDRIPTNRLLLESPDYEVPNLNAAMETARRRGARIEQLRRGRTIDFRDGVTAAVVSPVGPSEAKPGSGMEAHGMQSGQPTRKFGSDNDRSIVLLVRFGRCSVLLTGDAEAEAEARIIGEYPGLRADVLKIGHHGSRTSTTAAFVQTVRPRVAVISCGRRNRFGHPHPIVMERLESGGIRTFRTDRDGAVILETDGTKIWIRRTVR